MKVKTLTASLDSNIEDRSSRQVAAKFKYEAYEKVLRAEYEILGLRC